MKTIVASLYIDAINQDAPSFKTRAQRLRDLRLYAQKSFINKLQRFGKSATAQTTGFVDALIQHGRNKSSEFEQNTMDVFFYPGIYSKFPKRTWARHSAMLVYAQQVRRIKKG